jgi:hypothetical protein
MKRLLVVSMAVIAVMSCSGANAAPPVTKDAFEAAKRTCGASDAYLLNSGAGQAIAFKGSASDANLRVAQAKCLKDQLKESAIQIVGFISEPPSPR